MRYKLFALTLGLPLIAGCSDTISSEDALLKHGYSTQYVAGYHDGCQSGKRAGGDSFSQRARDEAAYGAGADYKTGWDYGFVTCRDEEARDLAIARAIGAGIAASSVSGSDGVDTSKLLDGVDTSAIKAAGW